MKARKKRIKNKTPETKVIEDGSPLRHLVADRCFLKPPIVDFGRLFFPSLAPNEYGFFSNDTQAIPRGTTLLIAGPPGAGKTIFALSFVRSLYNGELASIGVKNRAALGNLSNSAWAGIPILYYVSLEIFPSRLRNAVRPFGWLTGGREQQGPEDWVYNEREVDGLRPTMRFITAAPEIDRPVPGAEELLSSVFGEIERTHSREDDVRPIVVIVDSLTALLRSRNDYNERRRQAHETMYRLQKIFSRPKLFLTILISETDHWSTAAGSNIVEEYLAETVFRLDTRHLPLGRRLRTLEITKSQGMNITIGEHTWMIVTHATYRNLLTDPRMQRKVRAWALMPGEEELQDTPTRFGTITIHPRSRGFSRLV